MRIHHLLICLLLILGLFTAVAAEPVAGLKATDRIIFVGDSITGQGAKFKEGYVNLVREGLLAVHPDWNPTIVPLGGSGHSVNSWAGIEKTSRETAGMKLDIPEYDVKAELDKPADVVVILLGMNDILSPYVSEQPASLDRWSETYKALVTTLRERTKARIIGLATITMNTDDLKSPKNVMRAELNKRIADIAKAENCVLLPTSGEMEAILQLGRTLRPDFHPTNDTVHPNTYGHSAIAAAMLKGLGEADAAQKLREKYYPMATTKLPPLPALSYTLEPVATPLTDGKIQYTVRYWYTPDPLKNTAGESVKLQAPAGWEVTPATMTPTSGSFTLTGVPDQLTNLFTLTAKAGEIAKETTFALPAPWLIGSGIMSTEPWVSGKFVSERVQLPIDEALAKGEGLGEPLAHTNGSKLSWARYLASVDYVGGSDPASVDFTQVSFGKTFEVAYAARWIYSPIERPIQIQLGMNNFASAAAYTVFLNGTQRYLGALTSEPGRKATLDGTLNKGWNLLLVKSNHLQWQWQFSFKLTGVGADDLADLRYAATTKPPAAP